MLSLCRSSATIAHFLLDICQRYSRSIYSANRLRHCPFLKKHAYALQSVSVGYRVFSLKCANRDPTIRDLSMRLGIHCQSRYVRLHLSHFLLLFWTLATFVAIFVVARLRRCLGSGQYGVHLVYSI